jgi:hypothetical protein
MFPDRWIKGKSYRKYSYTVKDIAELTGRAIGTVRNDISNKRLIIQDLRSVVNYINECKCK